MINEKEKKILSIVGPKKRREYVKLKKRLGYVDKEYSIKSFELNRCIFIHIPKTGGVSISKAAFGNLACGHCTVKDYYFLFGKNEFEKMFTFTFVRNPFTRLASAYRFLKQGGINKQDQVWSKKYLSKYDSINDFVVNGLRREEIMSWMHFKKQVEFLRGRKSIDVDFIGRLEDINEDFERVKEKVKIKNNLKHENKTSSGSYKGIYNRKSRRIIRDVYKEDFEKLGYDK